MQHGTAQLVYNFSTGIKAIGIIESKQILFGSNDMIVIPANIVFTIFAGWTIHFSARIRQRQRHSQRGNLKIVF